MSDILERMRNPQPRAESMVGAAFVAMIGLAVTAVLFWPIVAAFFGGVAGWMVSWAFPPIIENLNALSGMGLTGWMWGSMLAFVGSFFRAHQTNNSK